uniref:Uncharacterized protein n=2 Tax=Rhizochromulina marina TaxID=1034831 RepID=A0A7S2WPA6_9STRA|mmetsp:Transcript_2934/g.8383  ORF Transcript_2934/g.8383 Transcript_2934/m.8383 type:complete len:986 (+) Transcript_2934:51-3008(+)
MELSADEKRQRRLEYLMAQSEVFAHFLSGADEGDVKRGGRGGGAAKAAKAKGGGRTRMSESAEDSAMMKGALQNRRVTRLDSQPRNIKGGTMRAYQLEGLNWMIKLNENGVNGILADEMGLGKTLQSISLLAFLKEVRGISGPHIVITPKSTVSNWMREIKKWCPELRPLKLLGSKEVRKQVVQDFIAPVAGNPTHRNWDVVVTSYEGVLKEKSTLTKIPWKYLMIDEAHRIKNEKSSLSVAVRLMKTQSRLLITGTPLQNNLHELWALLNFLLPDVFGSADDFDEWFSMGGEEARENVIRKLHTVLRPFMLRRVKADVEKDLPPKIETKLYIGLSAKQREWYTKILSKDAHSLNALGGPDRVKLLNVLMQLRKVCNHPYLFEGAEPGPPYTNGPHLWENAGKMVLLDKLLPKLRAQGSRVLIFSQMTRLLDILEDYMLIKGHVYCRIDGSTKGEDRDTAMDRFNAPDSPCFAFLLSTRAGGLGINLATADIVILYDSDWNPQVDLQAMDRAHRIGQTKTVRVFRFVTEGTVEEKIVERADRKLFLDAAVIQQGRLAEQNNQLSKGELMSMVKFGADEIFKGKTSTLSDTDIDVILKQGEQRTQEQQSLIQKDAQHSLANFSLLGDEGGGSLFAFEGEDYREKQRGGGLFLNLPQRERKRTYENLPAKVASSSAQRPRRGPPMHDFQFFQKDKLETLLQKEHELKLQRDQTLASIKELRTRASREQWGSDEEDPSAIADRLENETQTMQLSDREQATKTKLLEEGFGDWTRKDFKCFVAALEQHGREDTDNVFRQVGAETGKPETEVERYYGVFWKKGEKCLADWAKVVEKIERGEKKIARHQEIRDALESKVSRYEVPFMQLTMNYGAGGAGGARGKIWTEEEDAFLVCMMHRHGYGQWDRIRQEIRRAWQFKFDWFFKSRNSSELQRRCDILLRCIERENEELAKKSTTKRKGKAESGRRRSKNSTSAGGEDSGQTKKSRKSS